MAALLRFLIKILSKSGKKKPPKPPKTAKRKADKDGDDSQDRGKACRSCRAKQEELPCFKKPPKATQKDFEDQLQEQQDAINNTDIETLIKRRNLVKQKTTKALRNPKAQESARQAENMKKAKELRESARKSGKRLSLKYALEEAKKINAKKDATHVLDIIAGGDPNDISGLADRSANRSIGSQWKNKVGALDDVLDKQKQAGFTKPNVKLRPCK